MSAASDLVSRILEVAETYPDKLAVQCHDGSLSFRELVGRAAATADRIRQVAAHPTRVALVAADDLGTYCALLGIWLAGAAYVPLNPGNPRVRNVEILGDAAVDAIVGSSPLEAAVAAAVECHCPWVDVAPAGHQSPLPTDFTGPAGADLAYIIFTSGTTGRPKGVPIHHANLAALTDAWTRVSAYRMGPQDRFLQMALLSFDLSVMCTVVPWSFGASLHIVPHKGIAYLNVYRTLAEQQVTVCVMVPSVLFYLDRYLNEITLPDIRLSLFCGEALPNSLATRWAACLPNARLQNSYGPTEATVFCHLYDWERARAARESLNDVVPIGRPIHGMQGLIVDEQDRPLPPGEVGELVLVGPQVTDGYWRNAQRSAASFFRHTSGGMTENAYRTGDLASALPDGTVLWRGRKDHQVKIDGHRIELGEIEARARAASDSAAVAAVVQGPEGGERRIALFVEGGTTPIEAIEESLATSLPPYMRPAGIRRLQLLPLSANGKVDRNALMADTGT